MRCGKLEGTMTRRQRKILRGVRWRQAQAQRAMAERVKNEAQPPGDREPAARQDAEAHAADGERDPRRGGSGTAAGRRETGRAAARRDPAAPPRYEADEFQARMMRRNAAIDRGEAPDPASE